MIERFNLGLGVALASGGELPATQPGYDRVGAVEGADDHVPGCARPYTVEQDEDGVWCAHAELRAGLGANGEGDGREAASADLREALEGLIAEFGPPQEIAPWRAPDANSDLSRYGRNDRRNRLE